jgi:hypothetical protein
MLQAGQTLIIRSPDEPQHRGFVLLSTDFVECQTVPRVPQPRIDIVELTAVTS